MTTTAVKPTAKEAIKDQIASTLRQIDRCIADMTEKMNAGYLHFFEWTAENMFKAQKRRVFYAALANAVEDKDEAIHMQYIFFYKNKTFF